MKLVRRWPFLTLAGITLVIGVLWHVARARPDLAGVASATFALVSVIGAPFIAAMRLATATLGDSRLTPLVGLLLGLAPYVAADWLYRRRRRTSPVSADVR